MNGEKAEEKTKLKLQNSIIMRGKKMKLKIKKNEHKNKKMKKLKNKGKKKKVSKNLQKTSSIMILIDFFSFFSSYHRFVFQCRSFIYFF